MSLSLRGKILKLIREIRQNSAEGPVLRVKFVDFFFLIAASLRYELIMYIKYINNFCQYLCADQSMDMYCTLLLYNNVDVNKEAPDGYRIFYMRDYFLRVN